MSRAGALLLACALGLTALPARAQDSGPAQDVAPGAGKDGVVRVNALRNPEVHAYRAVVAGLDAFDAHHDLAPAVPRLLFQVQTTNGAPVEGELPKVKLSAATLHDGERSLPLTVRRAGFSVPIADSSWSNDAVVELEFALEDLPASGASASP